MISNFISKHYQNKQMNLAKIIDILHKMFMLIVIQEIQYSINSKETSFDNIIKDNSKTNSPSSHIEVSTSDLPSQYQTSSSSPSSSSSSSPPPSLVSTNPQNPDPISSLTNKLFNISLEDPSQNPENLKFKRGQLVTFNLEKVPHC